MGSQFGALFSGLWGDAGQNFVDLQGGPDKVFGKKPKVAPFVPVDLGDEESKALQANLDNADSLMAMLDKLIPGFSDMIKQGMDTSASLMRGEIPQDVQDQIMSESAFKSLMGGYGGSQMGSALTARDLVRTSLDLMQAGANSAQMWTKLAESSADPFIIKTMEQAGTTAANNAGTQANKQFEYNVKAAPDPGALGTFNLDTALGMQMLSFGMGAAGGAIGGAGGAAAAAGGANNVQPSGYYTNASGGAFVYNPRTGQYESSSSVWGGS